MKKEYFAVDFVQNSIDKVFTAICEQENNGPINDIVTGIDISSLNGLTRTGIKKLSKKSALFLLKRFSRNDIIRYKDTILDAKYNSNRKTRKVKLNTMKPSYR